MGKLNKKSLTYVIVFILIFSFFPVGNMEAYAASTILEPAEDTYINNLGAVGSGDYATLPGEIVNWVGSMESSGYFDSKAALKFDLSSISGTIVSAELRIRVSYVIGSPILNLYGLNGLTNDGWNENTASIPDTSGDEPPLYSGYSIASSGVKNFNVTSFINNEFSGDKVATFVLTGQPTGDSIFLFNSDEDVNYAPQLYVEYNPDTTPPTFTAAYPKLGTITTNSIQTLVNTDEAGTAYFVCLPAGAAQPSPDQVKAGTDAQNTPLLSNLKGAVSLTANVEVNFSSSLLSDSTEYDIYVAAEDSNDNLQTSVVKLAARTLDATPPTVALTDNDADNIVKQNDVVTITAIFSEPMTNAPAITITNGEVAGAAVTNSGDSTTWIYNWTVPAGNATAEVTVTGSDIAGNAYAGSDILTFTIDDTLPSLSSLSPADGAVDVGANVNLVITFNENVVKGTGNITIYDSNDTQIEQISVLNVNVNAAGNIVTIDPASDLNGETAYYVQIDATAFDEFSEGIYGADDGTAALTADKLSLTFTRNGGTATGATISSMKQNDNTDESLASALTGGETTVRVFLNITGTPGGNETIEITPTDGASVYDRAGNATGAGETTGEKVLKDQTPPTVNTLTPADNAVGVGVNDNLVMTFNENVVVGTGNITIKRSSDDSVVETIDVTGAKVSGGGTDTITIDPDTTLIWETGYYLQIDATAFDDTAGNDFAGTADTTTWAFTIIPSSNANLSNLTLSDGTKGCSPGGKNK